jgi:hypothetical protein
MIFSCEVYYCWNRHCVAGIMPGLCMSGYQALGFLSRIMHFYLPVNSLIRLARACLKFKPHGRSFVRTVSLSGYECTQGHHLLGVASYICGVSCVLCASSPAYSIPEYCISSVSFLTG